MPQRSQFAGFRKDPATDNLYINKEGTDVVQITTAGAAVTGTLSSTGVLTGTGGVTSTGALTASTLLNLTVADSTIASGVLTATTPIVNCLPESSTSDQVDSIVYTGAIEGTILICVSQATNTITFDDANINLGAATRAVAPGGSLVLYYDGSEWTEIAFLTASDNA